MLCKASPQNPARAGRQQRYAEDVCAVDYLGSSKFCGTSVRERFVILSALFSHAEIRKNIFQNVVARNFARDFAKRV